MSTNPSSPDSSTATPALLHATLQRLAAQSASCKLWSSVLAASVLLFAAGRSGGDILLWAAVPAVFLALADASYVSQASRVADYGSRLNGSSDAAGLFRFYATNGGLKSLAGLLSLSVWPYYVGLAGVTVGLAFTVLAPAKTGPPSMAYPQSSYPSPMAQMPPQSRPFTAPSNGAVAQPNRLPTSAYPNTAMPRPSMPTSGAFPPSAPTNANRPQPVIRPAPVPGGAALVPPPVAPAHSSSLPNPAPPAPNPTTPSDGTPK